MNNLEFLDVISKSFWKFLFTWSRSNEKLKILHWEIAKDLINKLWNSYSINSLWIWNGKEWKIRWRYIDKNVDITINLNNKPIAGIWVKFVMQNYSQNSNNYFENMLWETANIRSNNIPYYQIFIIPDRLPYYNNKWEITNWEWFNLHNSKKYNILSNDNIESYIHTPTKTLLFVISLPWESVLFSNREEYNNYYKTLSRIKINKSTKDFWNFNSSVIYNDYELFIEKVFHHICSL